MPAYSPTAEQNHAMNLFMTQENLAIEAGAGTGKTATLELLAQVAGARRGTYIAFNKAIVTEAGRRMPGNVTCSTAHSLAYRACGRRYAHRLNGPRMRTADIARTLRLGSLEVQVDGETKTLNPGLLASTVMRAIGIFCQSADPAPAITHVPYIDGIDTPTATGGRTYLNNNRVREYLQEAMTRAWADLSSEQGQLPFKHDHYLKLWQLGNPVIPGDFILFDEAQDANPVLLAIVYAQTHAQLVFVGDSQQQIYAFTGAINALGRIQERGGNVCYLTQSFRFGQPIADVANRLLGRLFTPMRLVGTPAIASVVAPEPEPSAVLTRTNATAVETFLRALEADRRPHLVGGGSEIISFARGAADLQEGRWTSHPELTCFRNWAEVQEYVENDDQGDDLRLLVKLIDSFGCAQIIRALEQATREADADVVISTAHKSKGRQWDSVQLAGDFRGPKEGRELPPDELRLLYVAVTRAQRTLDITAVPHVNGV